MDTDLSLCVATGHDKEVVDCLFMWRQGQLQLYRPVVEVVDEKIIYTFTPNLVPSAEIDKLIFKIKRA